MIRIISTLLVNHNLRLEKLEKTRVFGAFKAAHIFEHLSPSGGHIKQINRYSIGHYPNYSIFGPRKKRITNKNGDNVDGSTSRIVTICFVMFSQVFNNLNSFFDSLNVQ